MNVQHSVFETAIMSVKRETVAWPCRNERPDRLVSRTAVQRQEEMEAG